MLEDDGVLMSKDIASLSVMSFSSSWSLEITKYIYIKTTPRLVLSVYLHILNFD